MQMYSTLFFYTNHRDAVTSFEKFVERAKSDLKKKSPNSSLPIYGYSNPNETEVAFYALLVYDLDTTINYRAHILNSPFYDTSIFTCRFVNWYAAGGIALKK